MGLTNIHESVKKHSLEEKIEEEEEERDDLPYYENNGGTLVECGTTAGPFAMMLYKDWSPRGYERAIELFERGFYDHSHFFRVVPHFLVQFGIRYVNVYITFSTRGLV